LGKNWINFRDVKLETMPKRGLLELQSKKLRRQVKYVYDYFKIHRKMFDEKNIKPEDIKSAEDISKLPIITRNDIKKLITTDDPWVVDFAFCRRK